VVEGEGQNQHNTNLLSFAPRSLQRMQLVAPFGRSFRALIWTALSPGSSHPAFPHDYFETHLVAILGVHYREARNLVESAYSIAQMQL
jgi:hypothetical protein